MHVPLQIEQCRISIDRPLRSSPNQRKTKFLRALLAISAHSRLIEIEARCNLMPGPQPNETIKRLQQLNFYHAFRRIIFNYTLFIQGGGSKGIFSKFHFLHKFAIQSAMAPRQAAGLHFNYLHNGALTESRSSAKSNLDQV